MSNTQFFAPEIPAQLRIYGSETQIREYLEYVQSRQLTITPSQGAEVMVPVYEMDGVS